MTKSTNFITNHAVYLPFINYFYIKDIYEIYRSDEKDVIHITEISELV